MKHFISRLLALCLLAPTAASAQDWNREAYPDYNPNYSNPEPSLVKYGSANTRQKARAMAAANGLPDHSGRRFVRLCISHLLYVHPRD